LVIGVISDTHRYVWTIEKTIKKMHDADMIIHLGDNVQDVVEIKKYFKGNIIYVKGNCDFYSEVPNEIIETIEGMKFLITHGHRYEVKYNLYKLKERAQEVDADIVLYGHTHVSSITYEDGIWFVNPGSPSISRDGFNSVAIVEIENGKLRPGIRAV
jgi:uncharacterized protein